MTKGHGSELRIVKVKAPLSPTKLPGPMRPIQRSPAPSRAQALEALRATKGAASMIERVPALGQIGVWGEVAYWDACQTTGAAREAAESGVFIWGCDFPGALYNMSQGSAACLPYFAGKENLGDIAPPQNTGAGQVWCYFSAAANGLYLFVVQGQTYQLSDAPFGLPLNYTATIECLIDADSPYPLGEVAIPLGALVNAPFLINLPAGQYKFVIAQVSGAFFFNSLTAWIVPTRELGAQSD